MKKTLFAVIGVSILSFSSAYAKEVRDWRDLDEVHKHIQEAIHEMERAKAANHYDMNGHGQKAEQALREAERQLNEAVESARESR